MANDIDNLNRDAQRSATQDQAFAAQIEGRLKDLHTATPGVVTSYDKDTRTCSVQPSIQRVFSGVATNLPLLVDCPVVFPEGGGFVLTFPIVPGDEVLVVFSERAIDNWYQAGGTKPPPEYRMHDLSDGYVVPGVRNQSRNLADVSATAVELRNASGTQRISMRPDGSIKSYNDEGSTELTASGKFVIIAPGGLEIQAPEQTNTGTIVAQDTITSSIDVLGGGKSLKNHTHNLVGFQAGGVTKAVTAPL